AGKVAFAIIVGSRCCKARAMICDCPAPSLNSASTWISNAWACCCTARLNASFFRLSAGINDDDLDPDAAAGGYEGFCISNVRILWIDQHSNDCRPRVQQPEQLDAFRPKLAVDEADAGDVAARPVQAGDQPMLDRIAAIGEHDRDSRCR